jgi:site-specific DNA recombinase
MRVGIYARYSSDRQSDTSLKDQIRLCQARAKREGWTVVGVYEDAAASGALRMRRGYQTLLTDALSGKFDLVLAESLDRLNRDLEETARLFKRLKFVNVGIVTASEGPISEVHVSITGLMGEMYLKSLAEKTRRGLEGRVLAGKSGGGRSYGYDIVGMDASGQPVTGERKVNETEAEVVREIFRRFAGGEGPRAIARALNERGVPGPYGRPWGDTTIRGHAKKGTGILNNTAYVGRPAWGRQRFIKDPLTGRRVSRLNPAGSEVVTEVPHLRTVDEELWEAVKLRPAEVSRPLTDAHTTRPLNDLHRPRFLLSGLLTCGVCGGGFTITAKDRYGCARRSRQGTCSNNRGIKRQELERRVLDGLRSSLVTPDLVAEFISEYQAEWNRLQSERRAAASRRDRQLADVRRRIAGIIEAIERGIITPTTKARLEALEAEQAVLDRAPVEASLPAIHPNLAHLYRNKVARLEEELAHPQIAAEAKSVLRSLIKTIRVTPGAKRGEVTLELHGDLAAILTAGQAKRAKEGSRNQVSVVAGARFGRKHTPIEFVMVG